MKRFICHCIIAGVLWLFLLWLGLTVIAVIASRAHAQSVDVARVIATNGTPAREGFALPVTGGKVRVNVCLLAVDTGSPMKVPLWRLRAGKLAKVRTLDLANAPRQINLHQFPLPSEFVKGDLLVIEYAPGMLSFPATGRGAHPLATSVPFASVIDNRTNDPVTVPMTRIRFTP